MKLNFVTQIRVESNSGLAANVTIEVLDLTNQGKAADVLYQQRHRLSTDSFLTLLEPLVRSALQSASNQLIQPLIKEINSNVNAR